MTTYAICRDYSEDECFPFMKFFNDSNNPESFGMQPCDDTKYECWQPDCIEDDEFNLIIMLNGFPVKARGCHFDFVEGWIRK